MRYRLEALTFLICASVWAESADTGLQISAAGDIVGRFGANGENRLDAREAEVLLYAPVDPLFDARLSLAAHNENGATNFEIHELFVGSTKLIPRSRIRLGQFFLGVGRLNQFHRHDWPFTSAPKVQESFFHEEAARDTGLEYSYLLPTGIYLDLTLGVTNGWVFGHAHNIGTKPLLPTHYLRLATYTSMPWNGGMQVGANYLGRKDSAGAHMALWGLDVTAKWRENKVLTFLLQSELWYRVSTPTVLYAERTLGFYIYPQYGFSETLSVGLRFDGYSVVSLPTGNYDYGVAPTVAYRPSEFSTFRASYNILGSLVQGRETAANRTFEVQAVFILGSHPAHDF